WEASTGVVQELWGRADFGPPEGPRGSAGSAAERRETESDTKRDQTGVGPSRLAAAPVIAALALPVIVGPRRLRRRGVEPDREGRDAGPVLLVPREDLEGEDPRGLSLQRLEREGAREQPVLCE